MASGEGQSNPSTSGDAGRDHHEDFGNEYGPPLPTQEELREMEHCRLVGEATNLMLNFAKDPKLAKYMSETAFQDVQAQLKATTTSPPKPDSNKQYSEKELEAEIDARLARILGAQKQGKKHDKKRKKSTNFNGYLGSQSTFDKAKKHKKHAAVPSSSSSSERSSESSEEERRSKKRSRRHRHGKAKKKTKKSRSRRADDSSSADSSTDSSDSEDGHFYANKKNFYKANQYDFLEDKSKKVREFKEGVIEGDYNVFKRGVKWLNKFLEKIWPSVALAASELIRTNVEPMLALYAPPGIKLRFTKLFLGNVAPQIEGVKIQTLQAGQLIMDLDFKWGGDPSIILAVQTPVGANLPVQLKNLRFFSTVRVIFKLAEDIPCISGVVVALLAKPKPEIRYTLKLIGGNLNAVPGLSDMIKGIVESAVADNLEWPHRQVVSIAQPPVDLSDLELKLQGKLKVKVVRAQNLKNMEMIGKSDPYVVAYVRVLFPATTKVVENNLNPKWDEEFYFDVEDQETQALVFQVYDKDIGTDKLLGAATYPLAKLTAGDTKELALPLTPSLDMENVVDKRDRGQLIIKVTYEIYSREEQKAAMEKERALIAARKEAAEAGLIGGTKDVIGGAVGGAGKLVVGGAGAVGSGVGVVSSGIGRAGKYVAKSVSTPFTPKKGRTENGAPATPK
ncbi:hypothetical protein L7F22_001543 [Adiantum nelumboides]|nr:hypothetical protein [Adiantum nelumboides]